MAFLSLTSRTGPCIKTATHFFCVDFYGCSYQKKLPILKTKFVHMHIYLLCFNHFSQGIRWKLKLIYTNKRKHLIVNAYACICTFRTYILTFVSCVFIFNYKWSLCNHRQFCIFWSMVLFFIIYIFLSILDKCFWKPNLKV